MAAQIAPFGVYPAELDLELRVKGRGLRRIFGYPIATFPARFEMLIGHGKATSTNYRRDLATALREVADALEADNE